jgi:hypothetical protein
MCHEDGSDGFFGDNETTRTVPPGMFGEGKMLVDNLVIPIDQVEKKTSFKEQKTDEIIEKVKEILKENEGNVAF